MNDHTVRIDPDEATAAVARELRTLREHVVDGRPFQRPGSPPATVDGVSIGEHRRRVEARLAWINVAVWTIAVIAAGWTLLAITGAVAVSNAIGAVAEEDAVQECYERGVLPRAECRSTYGE